MTNRKQKQKKTREKNKQTIIKNLILFGVLFLFFMGFHIVDLILEIL